MKFTIHEMSIGEILERGVKLFFARLPVLFAIQFIALSPTLALQLALPDVAVGPGGNLLVLLPLIFLGPFASAAILRVITQEYLGQPIGLGEALKFALGRFLPLLITSILAGFGIGFGILCFCLPGIYLSIVWAFMSQVVVMENITGSSALARSKELVAGHFWRVFGTLFLIGLVVQFAVAGVTIAATMALPFQEIAPFLPNPNQPFQMPVVHVNNFVNYAIVEVVSSLVNVLGQTFIAVCATLLYFDLRNRKEAFDVGHIVKWLDQYQTWRDEPDVDMPRATAPPQTGIKETGPGGTRPETGIKADGNPPPTS